MRHQRCMLDEAWYGWIRRQWHSAEWKEQSQDCSVCGGLQDGGATATNRMTQRPGETSGMRRASRAEYCERPDDVDVAAFRAFYIVPEDESDNTNYSHSDVIRIIQGGKHFLIESILYH